MPKIHDSGGSGHHRGGRGRRVSSSLAEINVVPLVDVMHAPWVHTCPTTELPEQLDAPQDVPSA